MTGRLRTILAAGLAMAASSLPRIEPAYEPRPWPNWKPGRGRYSGRGNPAGTKLARKARQGRIGLATIR